MGPRALGHEPALQMLELPQTSRRTPAMELKFQEATPYAYYAATHSDVATGSESVG